MSKVIVIPTLMDVLPFHQVFNWERFQTLCADLLYKRPDTIESREYLSQGNIQHGIDVYSIKSGEEKYSVAQCKLVEYLGPQQVSDIIDEFLSGDLVRRTKEFILCTSADLKRQRDEEQTISEAREKLNKAGIDFTVWDERGLSKLLRINPCPEIVYHYFGEDISLGFYGDIWLQYVRKLRRIKKREYRSSSDYIERKIISYGDDIDNKKKNAWNFWEINKGKSLVQVLESVNAEQRKRLVLLSTAGYGKTEEINYAASYFSSEEKIDYPIKFSLRDYEGQSIEMILSNYHLEWRNIPEENILLLFDGLDEIIEKNFQTFINHLNSFSELHQKVKVVVSSRYNFYDINHTPPLREFDIYLLNPLSEKDIEDYLSKNLNDRKTEFEGVIQEHKFTDYIKNPYYLTRLVRFFKETDFPFPGNTVRLFERILFEQLEKDETIYNIPDLKEKLFPIASQIAFCMTLSGKSSLTDEEIKIVLPDSATKKLLNRFSIINRNTSSLGSWSFEHKNLQEYLCASALSKLIFLQIHKLISFEYNSEKLLPRFLNTLSFLFEILDKNTSLFQHLFSWINKNEPEVLIRFEKEQLSKETRGEIFCRIFRYYVQKQITLRVSSNFSCEELAAFVEIDEEIIDFLELQFESNLKSALAYDALSILGNCKKPYLYQEKLKRLLFAIISNQNHVDYVQAKAITTLVIFQFTERAIFEKILASLSNFDDRETRQACIFFLNNTEYYEEFSNFLLDSVFVLQKAYAREDIMGSFITLKQIILKFRSPIKIKKLFQYCVINKNWIYKYAHHREFHFELKEVKILLEKATHTYFEDKSILPIIYRLFCRLGYLSNYQDWFQPFYLFFKNTCGTKVIFEKFYKYRDKQRDLMSFADMDCCDFLIDEYKEGNIGDNEMMAYRNLLSHINRPLFLPFYEKLKLLDEKFLIDDINVDYNEVRKKQLQKNQLMLYDQKLFLEEAKEIFKIIKKNKITTSDLWISENHGLRIFQDSIVYESIRNDCIHDQNKLISKKQFLKKYSNDNEWKGFVIDSIVSLLKEKNQLQPNLLLKVNEWCIDKIQSLNFENSIIDQGSSFTYIPLVEFVKDVFLLLKLNMEDDLYLKLLPSDYQSFYNGDQDERETISSVIIKKIKNKDLLKDEVINNIKNKSLAVAVLCSHYSICHRMKYKECLPYLYKSITSNSLITGYTRIKLTEYYLDLGGLIADFNAFLKIPIITKEEEIYSSWEWFLIEKMLFIESEKISNILLEILNTTNQELNKLKAAEHLIELGKIEGLQYWAEYIIENKVMPFEHKWAALQKGIVKLQALPAIDILLTILSFFYNNGLQNLFRGSLLVDESVFTSLITITNIEYEYYTYTKEKLQKIILEFTDISIVDSLNFFSERLTQRYFESQKQEISIESAKLLFDKIFI